MSPCRWTKSRSLQPTHQVHDLIIFNDIFYPWIHLCILRCPIGYLAAWRVSQWIQAMLAGEEIGYVAPRELVGGPFGHWEICFTSTGIRCPIPSYILRTYILPCIDGHIYTIYLVYIIDLNYISKSFRNMNRACKRISMFIWLPVSPFIVACLQTD